MSNNNYPELSSKQESGDHKALPETSTESSYGIRKRAVYMSRLMDEYHEILTRREKGTNRVNEFWDLVVLSAGDQDQKTSFEVNIKHKRNKGFIPNGVEFKVFSDPGGIRVGDGGASLHILKELHTDFGDKLFSMRILVIHAGGYSKRLPSHSKIFSALPISTCYGEPYQMLDVKLLMYLPFLRLMPNGGVLFSASDDLESFNIDSGDFDELIDSFGKLDPNKPCLCAIAHPSSLKTGTGHGVFKFSKETLATLGSNTSKSAFLIRDCLEVFQKPSIAKMHQKDLVISLGQSELVYTDSFYWINPILMRYFLTFHDEIAPIDFESSIYSDFMTCQGLENEKVVVRELSDISEHSKTLEFKRKVFSLMNNIPLMVLTLPQSSFYHIGTLSEYLEAFCSNSDLSDEFGFEKIVCSTIPNESNLIDGTLIASVLKHDIYIPRNTVLEFTRIDCERIILNANTILSNCHISVEELTIPGDHVFHTVPTLNPNKGFVTIAFHINDDIKKLHTGLSEMHFGNHKLAELVNDLRFSSNDTMSLWNARLFPLRTTRSESFQRTLEIIAKMVNIHEGERLFSMEDLLQIKDTKEIIRKGHLK